MDLKQIAQTTAGFTGADLENLLNEAAIMAAKDRRRYYADDIKKAFIKVGIGAEKSSKVISDKEKDHSISMKQAMRSCSMYCRIWRPVYTISIIPTGNGRSRLHHAAAGE